MATTRSKIVAELIGTAGTIDNAKLTGSITNDKLAGSITNAKLAGSISADKLAPGAGGTDWAHTDRIQSSNFNAISNKGYYVNTSSAAVTVTLPSTPADGDVISLVDVTGSANSNIILINPNGKKINGNDYDFEIASIRSGVQLTYSGSTYGWIATESVNDYSSLIIVVGRPIVSSFANSVGEQYFQADGNPITITGRNFKSDATVRFTDASGSTYDATGSDITVSSATSIIANIPTNMTPDSGNTQDGRDPFDIRVTNAGDGKFGEILDLLEYLPAPTFGGASTSLGHIYRGEAVNTTNLSGTSVTITASSLDSDDVVAIATTPSTGSLPPGMTVSVSGSSGGVDTATLGGTITSSNTASGKENITFKFTATSTSGAESLTQESSTYTVELRSTRVTSATALTPSTFVGASNSSFTIAGIGFNGSTYPVKSANNGGVKFVNTATSFTQNAGSITINSDQQMTVTTSADITAAQAGSGLDVVVELTNGDIFKLSDESSSLITAPAGITAGTPTTLTNTITSDLRGQALTGTDFVIPAATDANGGSIVSYALNTAFSASTGLSSDANWLSFNPSNRQITGNVPSSFITGGGSITVPIRITDNVGNTLDQDYTITVDAQGFLYPLGISHSAMFDGSSALKKTYGSTTISTYSVSVWFKRSNLSFSGNGYIFSEHDTAGLYFATSYPDIRYYGGGTTSGTSPALRDTSSWYHVVWVVNGSAGNLYLNGGSTPILTVSSAPPWGNTTGMYFGSWSESHHQFEGYMANIDFIDGQALSADYFGKTQDGVWVAKTFNGQDNTSGGGSATNDYGTNGFKLTFADSGDLGKDTAPISGNHTAANNWTNV